MTLKDKKNNREYNRKLKAEGGKKEDGKEKGKNKKKEDNSKPAASNFTGVSETADKLIAEANQRFHQEEESQVRIYLSF